MKNLLSLIFILCSFNAFAIGRLDLSYGYFSINSKTTEKSTSISNPAAANLAYLLPFGEKTQLNMGYTVLLADMSGSDKAYGLNVGVNYFPISSSLNEKLKSDDFEVERYEIWKPYIGLGFYQREFQSIKNSYAGFGINPGIERYFDKLMSFKGELRYIALSGSNESTATEINAFLGVIFKI
jgi:hypothetical protein